MEIVGRRVSVRGLVALVLLGAAFARGVPGRAAHAALTGDPDALAGLVIGEADLALDAADRVALGVLPGIRDRQPLDAVLQIRLEELIEERDAIGAHNASGAEALPVPPLPGDGAAPPRVDSGAPDPDRPRTPPPPPAVR